ncbi:MAG TPA: Yip1 family protein [Candidatus Bathyarchaeia archaeon]|nr:Yip1 family protein [Candidatus Bathyarchaeia archaeon]
MFAYGIFKVIYSPLKAFKEILQNPRYRGAFLVLIIFAATYAASAFVVLSKTYDERTLPTLSQGDIWTENRTLWTSNAQINESSDGINGGFYGNRSIEFTLTNSTKVSMSLNFTESVNCSSSGGYQNMSLRMKIVQPNSTEVSNINLSLFSSAIDHFDYNLTEHVALSDNNTAWNNLTIPVGPESDWTNSSINANWSNITGLRIELTELQNTNWTVRLDGLFFRGGYVSALDAAATTYVFSFSLVGVMIFVIRWIFVSGLLYLLVRALGGKTAWKTLLVMVGYALMTMVVASAINIVLYSALPTINYSLEALSGATAESEAALTNILGPTTLVTQVGYYIQIAMHFWAFVLCAIIVRTSTELSWNKSILVGFVAYWTSIFIASLLLGY